jgi:molecular chaperone GrpE (heat shock protein)
MSPTPPTLNPSQTVERIREIIVGRHLERLECRISRLESAPAAAAPKSAYDPSAIEDRLLATEARVEALQDHAHRMEHSREDIERTAAMYRGEAQRLASQIQEVAREKSASAVMPAVDNLERKLGAWLTDWQKSLNSRLETRDRQLTEGMRAELESLKKSFESRFSDIESKVPSNIDDRFGRIAAAARALAESAASFSTQASPKA